MMKYIISWIVFFEMLLLACMLDTHARERGADFRKPVESIRQRLIKRSEFKYGPGDYVRKLRGNMRNRFYEIHVPPSYNKSTPTPAVLVFHGGGGDPGSIRYESQMDGTADKEGFIVVYPAGTPTKRFLKNRLLLWNDGRPDKDGVYSKVDDVSFVVALLDDLSTLFNIDKKRIYACGYSNGAQFTYRLIKRLSNRIAASAMVAGHRPVQDEYDPKPSRPIAIMQFSGTEDKLGPYYGGSTPSGAGLKGIVKPVKETIKSWVDFNGCPPKPAAERRIGKAMMNRFGPCQNGTEVILWTLEGGGHTWPGGKVVPNVKALGLGQMGEINQDINASDLMWKFFKKFSIK
jgi:polyhydroxybutyrate depolymerase